ncbi:NACHT, LRR and PYD domains-containing protein 12-like [Scyliorhinus canicula]|uniref:NACHT, LRR and PYD domains-containing protein 12-like n=1 Tax=Scyliorhinus canicula TaxID=7830 RepID=UPI0018F49831|nr:NACHT, LRR and PYD domains-containing protein 12-like [Scyliorhinus canicula]
MEGQQAPGLGEEVDKVRRIFDPFNEREVRLVHEHFVPELVNIVLVNMDKVISDLMERGVFTEQEAEDLYQLKRKGEKDCAEQSVVSVQGKNRQDMMTLWETLCQFRTEDNQHFTLAGVLTELQNAGQRIVLEIQNLNDGVSVSGELRACRDELKRWVRSWTEGFDQLKVPWGKKPRRSIKLEERYTELAVVAAHRLGKNRDNEMMDTANVHESLASVTAKGHEASRPMRVDHLFRKIYNPPRPSPPVLVVVVCGVPGIGKTTMVQKLLHDWAAGKIYHQFTFIFHFQFRELNLMEGDSCLVNIIANRHPFLESSVEMILKQPEQILFIFDGLDESKEQLNFKQACEDQNEHLPVSTIVASLVSQKLLKGCSVLVTTRPIALETLESGNVHRYTEILGFFPEQRLRYFEKFYGQKEEGQRVYKHVRGHGTLYTLCFNPSYCWILCSALEGYFAQRQRGVKGRPPPRTITQLFSLFLANLLTNHARYATHKTRSMLRISKMAFTGVKGRHLVFYQKDLKDHRLESSQFLSGFLMEFMERDLGSTKMAFSFLHLTIQEYLAALYFVLGCKVVELNEVLGQAVRCEDGRYEIFSRFLSGLSKPANSAAVEKTLGVLPKKPCSIILDWLINRTQEAMKREDKQILLQALHCLFEAQQEKLVRDTLGPSATIDLSAHHLNPVDCSAVAYTLGSLDTVERFDASSSIAQLEGLDHLLPHLNKCKEIGLDNNNLRDEWVQKLCTELKKPGGKFTTLLLCGNHLTKKSCEELVSLLHANPQLISLDLGNNSELGDSGVETLCLELQQGKCQLERLGLRNIKLSSGSGRILASAISGNWSLTHLDINDNSLKDIGLSELYQVLTHPKCRIESLKLESNALTKECCDELGSALARNRTVKELNLSFNDLEDSGLQRLVEKMGNRECKLHTLKLSGAKLTEVSGKSLSCVLRENPTLRNIDLSNNQLKDVGLKLIVQALEEAESQVEKLW